MTKQMSGGARLKASGKKPILLGTSKTDHGLLRRAAKKAGMPITTFVLSHSLAAARVMLGGE